MLPLVESLNINPRKKNKKRPKVLRDWMDLKDFDMDGLNKGVVDYFQSLGYKVDWDRCGGQCFHEILDQKGICVMQVDWHIPIEAIKQDLIMERDGVGVGSSYDYIINGSGEKFDELLSKIV